MTPSDSYYFGVCRVILCFRYTILERVSCVLRKERIEEDPSDWLFRLEENASRIAQGNFRYQSMRFSHPWEKQLTFHLSFLFSYRIDQGTEENKETVQEGIHSLSEAQGYRSYSNTPSKLSQHGVFCTLWSHSKRD